MDYFKDLIIDENNLDENTERQAILNMQYSELRADKGEELNNQKLKIKVADASLKEKYGELYLKYKQVDFAGKSPTEKTIESQILIDKEYKAIHKKYFEECKALNKIQKEFDYLDGAVTSFQHRKNMLEERIKLWISSYNGEIKQQKKLGEDMREKLNRKKENE